MMQTIDIHKYQIIAAIMKIADLQVLLRVEKVLEEQATKVEETPPAYMRAVKPLRKGLTLEQLAEESGYKPIDREAFFKKVDALDIEEPLEDLLAMLTP